MSTNSFYFNHDYNARGDQKVLILRSQMGWEGYGLFFATCECLCESKGYITREGIPGIAFGLSIPVEKYTNFLDLCLSDGVGLLKEDETGIYSDRILEHLEWRKKLSDSGKQGGRPRKSQALPTLKPGQSQAKAIYDRKDIKEKGDTPPDGSSIVIMTKEQLREHLLGEIFIEEVCMKLGADKNQLLKFAKEWVAKKEITGDFKYTKSKLRTFLLSDWEKQQKPYGTSQTEAPRMTRAIGKTR